MLRFVSTSIAFCGIKSEIAVHRTNQPPHGNQRSSHQHRTDRNLHHEQNVPDGNPASGIAGNNAG